jgi:hypothetical protein
MEATTAASKTATEAASGHREARARHRTDSAPLLLATIPGASKGAQSAGRASRLSAAAARTRRATTTTKRTSGRTRSSRRSLRGI